MIWNFKNCKEFKTSFSLLYYCLHKKNNFFKYLIVRAHLRSKIKQECANFLLKTLSYICNTNHTVLELFNVKTPWKWLSIKTNIGAALCIQSFQKTLLQVNFCMIFFGVCFSAGKYMQHWVSPWGRLFWTL